MVDSRSLRFGWYQLKVIIRCPAFLPALLDEPPAVVLLFHYLNYVVLLERHFALLTVERKLGFP